MRFIWAVVLLSGLATCVQAREESSESRSAFRFGAGVDRTRVEADLLGAKLDGKATGFEAFFGWELNRYLAVEAGYIDGGKPDDEIGAGVIETDISAPFASILGSLWVNDYVSFYGRAGLLHWKADTEGRLNGVVLAKAKDDGDDPFFGLGIAAAIEGALLRAEYRIAELDDVDFSAVSVNIAWRF